MRWRPTFYLIHRWLALVVGLQLLVWSISGFTFTILDIDDVHGDFERSFEPLPPVRVQRAELSPTEAMAAAVGHGTLASDVSRISLRERFGRTVYELFDKHNAPLVAVDASNGEVIPRISRDDVAAAAKADFSATGGVASVEWLEGEAPLEFRGGPMPVYRVILDHPKEPHLYISPITGRVLKRRNDPWRLFDFLWMLHIMDYQERDDFNHWLLTGMSALAILTSATGLALWVWRIPRRRARIA